MMERGEKEERDRDRSRSRSRTNVSGCTVHLIECLALAFEWLSSAKPASTNNSECECECECKCENCINAWHFSTLAIAISIKSHVRVATLPLLPLLLMSVFNIQNSLPYANVWHQARRGQEQLRAQNKCTQITRVLDGVLLPSGATGQQKDSKHELVSE